MIRTIFSYSYTYIIITILLGIIIVYLLHKRQLSMYAKTMPNNYNILKAEYGKPLCTFEGTVREIFSSSYSVEKVWHPVVVDVYVDFVIISAFGYASILNSAGNNYVINNKEKSIQLSYSKSPYIMEIEFDKDEIGDGWSLMKKTLAAKDDTYIE